MPALDRHQALLRRQWADEALVLEQRRQRLLAASVDTARRLRHRWPGLAGLWLFGSATDSASFRRHSDLDLAVEGLPTESQIEALAVAERAVDAALEAAGEAGIGIDLVRLEDLDPHWQRRIRERALPLA